MIFIRRGKRARTLTDLRQKRKKKAPKKQTAKSKKTEIEMTERKKISTDEKTDKNKDAAVQQPNDGAETNTAAFGDGEINENNCDVDKTKQALSELYKNVTMAKNCVKTILHYVEEQDVTKSLHKQVEQYDCYIEQIESVSKNLNFEPSPAPKALAAMANMGIKMKMMTDKTTTHIAKIMLQGTCNGIIDLYRLMKTKEIHPEVAILEKQVLRFEECRFEGIKSWL